MVNYYQREGAVRRENQNWFGDQFLIEADSRGTATNASWTGSRVLVWRQPVSIEGWQQAPWRFQLVDQNGLTASVEMAAGSFASFAPLTNGFIAAAGEGVAVFDPTGRTLFVADIPSTADAIVPHADGTFTVFWFTFLSNELVSRRYDAAGNAGTDTVVASVFAPSDLIEIVGLAPTEAEPLGGYAMIFQNDYEYRIEFSSGEDIYVNSRASEIVETAATRDGLLVVLELGRIRVFSADGGQREISVEFLDFDPAHIAVLTDGSLAVAGYSFRTGEIRVQIFSADGQPQGASFVAATIVRDSGDYFAYDPGDFFDLFPLASGGFTVTWTSAVGPQTQVNGQVAASDSDIFSQNFAPTTARASVIDASTGVVDEHAGPALLTLQPDGPVNAAYSYVIVSDSSGLFAISGNALVLRPGVAIDYEAGHTRFEVTVRATDEFGRSVTEVIAFDVRDNADLDLDPAAAGTGSAPVFFLDEGNPVRIAPDAVFDLPDGASLDGAVLRFGSGFETEDRFTILSAGTGPGQIAVQEPFPGASNLRITYGGVAIGSYDIYDNEVTFNADATEAAVQELIRSLAYSYVPVSAAAAPRTFDISLTGPNGLAANLVRTVVEIATINEAPTGGDFARVVVDGRATAFTLADFPITDAEGHSLGAVLIDTLPDVGTLLLEVSGTWRAVAVGDEISAADIAAGRFAYRAPDLDAPASASFTFRVRDNGSDAYGSGLAEAATVATLDIELPYAPPPILPSPFDLGAVGAHGFDIQGGAAGDRAGFSVAAAEDVNGDGFADILIGAPGHDGSGVDAGAAFLLFGRHNGFGTVNLAALTAAQGLTIRGAAAGEQAGISVASAGDFNGDGHADLIIGASLSDAGGADAGAAYLVYGGPGTTGGTFDLASLDAARGVRLIGATAGARAGSSVASAGDLNGDGFGDVVIAAPGGTGPRTAYVVFGTDSAPGELSLGAMSGTTGLTLVGSSASGTLSIAAAGDVNGDGIGDLIVGESAAGSLSTGAAYVVYGRTSYAGPITLASMDAATGFAVTGSRTFAFAGTSVAPAGDFNGDGYADLIVSQTSIYTNHRTTYVLLGREGGLTGGVLPSTDTAGMIRLTTINTGENSGFAVASAGDVNGDGFADLIIGSPPVSGSTVSASAYLVYGRTTAGGISIPLASTIAAGIQFVGDPLERTGHSVSSAGDINGDGYADFIIGAPDGFPNGSQSGFAHIIFGRARETLPLGSDGGLTVAEDGTLVLALADFGFSDADGDAIGGVIVTALPASGSLLLGDAGARVPVSVSQRIDAADIAAGRLVLVPAADFNSDGGRGPLTVGFTVVDASGYPAAASNTLSITVTSVNDVPTIVADETDAIGSITELPPTDPEANSRTHSDSGTITFADLDIGDSWSATAAPAVADPRGLFQIVGFDPVAGTVQWLYTINDGSLDHFAEGETRTETFNVTISDGNGGTVTQAVTVTLNGTTNNIAPTAIDIRPAAFRPVQTFTFDEGLGAWTASGGSPEGSVTIDRSGAFGGDPAVALLRVVSSDAFIGASFTAPTLTSPVLSLAAGQVIRFTYRIASAPNDPGFETDSIEVFGQLFDADTGAFVSYVLQASATGEGTQLALLPGSGNYRLTFDLQAINRDEFGGVDASLGIGQLEVLDTGVSEDAPYTFADMGAAILAAADDLNGDALTIVVAPTSAAGASVTFVDGVLVYDPGTVFQHLTAGQSVDDTVSYTVSDGQGGTATANIIVTVHGADDAPTATLSGPYAATEQVPIDIRNTLSIIDVDGGDLAAVITVTLSVSSGLLQVAAGGSGVEILAGNGSASVELRGTMAQLNALFGSDATASLTYTADSDDPPGSATLTLAVAGGGSASQTIAITTVNDAPEGHALSITIGEDAPHVLSASDFGFTDRDGGSLASVILTNVPVAGAGALYFDTDGAGTGSIGTALVAGSIVTAAQIEAGQLVYVPGEHGNGTAYASFTFQVQDDGTGTAPSANTDGTPDTITFNVTARNDAPAAGAGSVALPAIAEDTIPAGQSLADLLGTIFTDADGDAFAGFAITGNTALAEQGRWQWFDATDLLRASDSHQSLFDTEIGSETALSVLARNELESIGILTVAQLVQTDLSYFLQAVTSNSVRLEVDNYLAARGLSFNTVLHEDPQGSWHFVVSGPGWVDVGAVSPQNALLLAAGTLVRFLPGPDFNGSPPSLTGRLVDSSQGAVGLTEGTFVDASLGGGVSRFSPTEIGLTQQVTSVDDVPVGNGDAFGTDEASAVSGNLFANDHDVDGALAVTAVNGSAIAVGQPITLSSGALLTVNADGTYRYDPNGAFDALRSAASGASNVQAVDSFTYTLAGASSPTNVTITIDGLDLFEQSIARVSVAFGPAVGSGGWESQNDFPRVMGDVNGDGRADIVGFGIAGTYVALGQADGTFGQVVQVSGEFGQALAAGGWTSNDRNPRLLGDVNGDGRADIVGFGEAGTYVALADGQGGFGAAVLAVAAFGATAGVGGWESQDLYHRALGDVNGDGRDDIVGFGIAGTYVALANADGTFGALTLASLDFGQGPAGGWGTHDQFPRMLADVNGDGRADIVGFAQTGAYVSYANANGTFAPMKELVRTFGAAPEAGGWESQSRYPRALADVNGDGLVDMIGFGEDGVFYALNNGAGGFGQLMFGYEAFANGAGGWTTAGRYPRTLADVNGDGRADIIGFGEEGVYVTLAGGPSVTSGSHSLSEDSGHEPVAMAAPELDADGFALIGPHAFATPGDPSGYGHPSLLQIDPMSLEVAYSF